MLDVVDAQHANLLKRPSRQSLGKFAVLGLDLALADARDLGLQPLVLQHLRRAEHRHARRVARLHRRHQGQLPPRREELVRVDRLELLLGVVAVGRGRGAQHGREQVALAEGVARDVGQREDAAGDVEVVLEAGAHSGRDVEDEHVVRLGGREGVVVEVVDDGTRPLGGQGDVELGEQGDDGRGRGRRRRQGHEDVALGVDKVDEQVRRQVGAQAWRAISFQRTSASTRGDLYL